MLSLTGGVYEDEETWKPLMRPAFLEVLWLKLTTALCAVRSVSIRYCSQLVNDIALKVYVGATTDADSFQQLCFFYQLTLPCMHPTPRLVPCLLWVASRAVDRWSLVVINKRLGLP